MIELVVDNLAPIMFVGLFVFLLSGNPVSFSLAACGLFFGWLGVALGVPGLEQLLNALPLRIIGILKNETLLAIPFFTMMGLILERSRMAEDLLSTIGQVFGPVRGGLVYAVIIVGAMLAATTGVVAASVISMGLISLPIMLRYGCDRRLITGSIAAAGTLAQIIPPSLVLIVIADQLGRSVGDLFLGAFIPGFLLTGMYCLWVFLISRLKPEYAPPLPPEARTLRETDGSAGYTSLWVLVGIAFASAQLYAQTRPAEVPTDELIVTSMMLAMAVALTLTLINRLLKLGLLSQLAERVTFVLIPPLALIFLVLGTIFLGWATPTEGGAMGAMGALVMALARKRLNIKLLVQAMESTLKLSSFVMFILLGATVFSLTFQGVDGTMWVEDLLSDLPGGQIGFLVVVNLMVFVLGFFLDFFELAFIIIPLLAPVAESLGIDLIWFGILLAINMQTSFLTPPIGFALFYMRSVVPENRYIDKITQKVIEPISTTQIYRGAIPFIFIQVTMLAVVMVFPELVTGNLDKPEAVDIESIELIAEPYDYGADYEDGGEEEPDPTELLLQELQQQ